uniref:ZP domain-containing protein n=1 Tax=Clastoptera arizonana TaxID=38151 RepID=A0A1B6CA23_9HEMI
MMRIPLALLIVTSVVYGQTVDQDFTPAVTATCKGGFMTIKVATNQSFVGALHGRDYRTPSCITYGNGSHLTTLVINLFAHTGTPDYCGVLVNNKTEERSLPIAVRIHRTLELADDKLYVITCGKAGFRNAKNETSLVSLKVLEKGKRVQEVVYTHPYTLRADISRPDGTYGIRVKNCFAFNKRNNSVNLVDDRGCSINSRVISQFKYDEKLGHADATIFSMFRFSDSSEVHFQCDIAVCKGLCPEVTCDDQGLSALARAQPKDIYSETTDEGVIMASTSVFVLEPGQSPLIQELCEDGSIHPSWLLYLCIAFGLMFLIMLIINIFLCSAMTCACARTEVIEKEPSIIEDYDPYRSWHGSQYGSRYSLNGKPGYVSGGSTMNSTRSISTNSDHYAIVQSRPGSRYSPGQKNGHRGPSSNLGSHYSGKM